MVFGWKPLPVSPSDRLKSVGHIPSMQPSWNSIPVPRYISSRGCLVWTWRMVSRWRQITLTNQSVGALKSQVLWLVHVVWRHCESILDMGDKTPWIYRHYTALPHYFEFANSHFSRQSLWQFPYCLCSWHEFEFRFDAKMKSAGK